MLWWALKWNSSVIHSPILGEVMAFLMYAVTQCIVRWELGLFVRVLCAVGIYCRLCQSHSGINSDLFVCVCVFVAKGCLVVG